MILLLLLVLVGVLSGYVSGAHWGGDWPILGASSGLVLAVAAWLVTNTVRRALYEVRINRHFKQDSTWQERADRLR